MKTRIFTLLLLAALFTLPLAAVSPRSAPLLSAPMMETRTGFTPYGLIGDLIKYLLSMRS